MGKEIGRSWLEMAKQNGEMWAEGRQAKPERVGV